MNKSCRQSHTIDQMIVSIHHQRMFPFIIELLFPQPGKNKARLCPVCGQMRFRLPRHLKLSHNMEVRESRRVGTNHGNVTLKKKVRRNVSGLAGSARFLVEDQHVCPSGPAQHKDVVNDEVSVTVFPKCRNLQNIKLCLRATSLSMRHNVQIISLLRSFRAFLFADNTTESLRSNDRFWVKDSSFMIGMRVLMTVEQLFSLNSRQK
jgi:hypothetical protein